MLYKEYEQIQRIDDANVYVIHPCICGMLADLKRLTFSTQQDLDASQMSEGCGEGTPKVDQLPALYMNNNP